MRPTRKIRHQKSHALLMAATLMMIATLGQSAQATGDGQTTFKRVATQYIAALADPGATAGTGAES